jgi:hypothetical protein
VLVERDYCTRIVEEEKKKEEMIKKEDMKKKKLEKDTKVEGK